jgi:tetratricopeptide (TPR) repeat protein
VTSSVTNADPERWALDAETHCRSGHLELALEESDLALRAQRSPWTLLARGRCLSLIAPQAGLEVLQEGLGLAEVGLNRALTMELTTAIAQVLIRLGQYAAASDWAQWNLRECEDLDPSVRLPAINALVTARMLGGVLQDLRTTCAELETDHDLPSRLAQTCALTLADLRAARGEAGAALEGYERLWAGNRFRDQLGPLALRFVPALCDANRIPEALEVARQASELSAGLHPVIQRHASIAQGVALASYDPIRARSILERVTQDCLEPLDAPTLARAGLHLAHVCLQLADAAGANTALEMACPGLAELGAAGRRLLVGTQAHWNEVFALLETPSCGQTPEAPLELHFLGGNEVCAQGQPLQLRKRFAEIIAVLAMHPQGLTGEQLTLAVYGEDGSLECCKTELSRLRQLVPIETRPYRLGVAVRADFLELEAHLSRGELEQALALHHGPLLPESNSPEVIGKREQLEEALRRATLRSHDPNLLWGLAERLGEDLDLWQACLKTLKKADPRRALASARVNHLRRAWGV